MAGSKSVVEIKKLKKRFGPVRAVDGVSFDVQRGEIFGFLGPNGAGKTTTIRCLMDFLRPDSGEIRVFGRDARRDGPEIRRRIGYLPGDVRLYGDWTGQEHVRFFERFNGPSQARRLARELGLDLRPRFKNLSSGNRQKLGLVLALMHRPELLVMDEPTLGLDPLLQNKIYKILNESAAEGATVFMSSHNLAEVERICGRVAIIKSGKLIEVDSVRTLKGKRIYRLTASFAGEVPAGSFKLPGVKVLRETPEMIVLRVKGEVGPVLDRIRRYDLHDIEITHESLEQIFMEFYR